MNILIGYYVMLTFKMKPKNSEEFLRVIYMFYNGFDKSNFEVLNIPIL